MLASYSCSPSHDEPYSGYKAIGVACDVSDEEQAATMVKRTADEFGRLDFAYNNAGIQVPPTDAADETADDFDKVNAVNLRGIWACMKHELKQMRSQDSGEIVNCSSLGGLVGLPERGAYHASKHGVIGLTKSGARIRASRHPHQRYLPWSYRVADGRRHADDAEGRNG